MAFNNGFSGDTASLNYILQTLEAKQVAIPGITCNPSLSVSAAGEVAYYYKRKGATVADGNLGSKVTFVEAGGERVDISLIKAIQIKSVIPHANFATVSADVVGDRVIADSMQAANLHNEMFAKAVETGATKSSGNNKALDKSNVYGTIVDVISEFKTAHKADGLKPTAVLVNAKTEGLLLQSPEFIRSTNMGDEVVYEGVIGKIAGLYVVEALDLATANFIVLCAEGVAAPTNVNTLYVTDATAAGYPGGTLISGEIGYGFKVEQKFAYKQENA